MGIFIVTTIWIHVLILHMYIRYNFYLSICCERNFYLFFICFKYKILFRVLNQRLSRISVRNKKRLLSVDNHLCDSVVKANEYMGNIFVISVVIRSPNCCVVIYIMIFAKVNQAVTYIAMASLLSFISLFICLMF